MRNLLLSIACFSMAAGCGGDDSPRGVTEDLASAVCDLTFGCCTEGEAAFLLGPFVTAEDCAERLVNSAALAPGVILNLSAFADINIELPNLAVLENAIEEGRTKVNRGAVDACVEFLREQPCNMVEGGGPTPGCVAPEPPEETPCELDLLFTGLVGNGETCTSPGINLECKAGLACRQNGLLGVTGACVEPGDIGDLCFFDAECANDLYCKLLDGTCDVPKLEGETCAYADPDDPSPPPNTLLIACDDLLTCDPVTDTCVAACQRGASCFADSQCDDEANLQCILGRCDLPRAEGQPCNQLDDCQPGLRCAFDPTPQEFVCQPLLANGEICNFNDTDCSSGYCDQLTNVCAAALPPGGLCTSSADAQCAAGYCDSGFIACTMDGECVASGVCNIAAGRCEFFCVADRADGAMCDRGPQCTSDVCIFDNLGMGTCRTPPLADGLACTFDAQCESEFCGVGFPRVCASLPLANGESCNQSTQCGSGICDFGTGLCDAGLPEGSTCNGAGQPPCARDLYCDSNATPQVCTPFLEAGSPCENSLQCRGGCSVRFNRLICDSTPADDAAVCDGM